MSGFKFRLYTDTTDITIGNGTDYFISPPIQGLELPPIRTSSQNYSGRDGGRVNAQYYSPRLITLIGGIDIMTCPNHEQARKDLQLALPIRSRITMEITTPSGEVYVTFGNILDVKMDYEATIYSRYKFDFLSNSVYFLTADENSAIVNRFQGGGFVLPVTLPIIFSTGVGVVTINNNGSETVYPTITVTATADTPRITNVDSQEFIEFDLQLSSTDELVINMEERTATLNGGSVLSLMNPLSRWWGLDTGANRVRFNTDNGADTGTATVEWRNAVLTI